MTDAQFLELMAKLDSFWLMTFVGFIVVIVALGLIIGGQR